MAAYRNTDQFMLDAYSGEGGFLSGTYLEKFPRESDTNFEARQALAVYPNYTKKAVDIYSRFLWQRAPSREADDAYSAFAANADGAGTALDMLLQIHQRLAMLLGTVYLIVDRPAGAAQTRAEQGAPYLAMRQPSELMRYTVGPAGQFRSCTFSEVVDGRTQYRTFNEDGQIVSTKEDGTDVISQTAYKLGRPPVVRLHSTIPLRATDIRAQAWVHDLAQLNWDLFNQCSELRWLFRSQAFAMLRLPAKDQNERERLASMTIGPNNALTYDPTDGGEPDYFAPPPEPVKAYQENIVATVERIYQAANLEFVGSVNASGVALQMQFMQCNGAVGIIASATEQAETEIAQLVAAWEGREWKGKITYPRDFNLIDLAEELKQGMDAISLGVSPTFDQEVKKRVARQYLGHNVTQQTMEAIDKEIEGGADPYGDRVQREAQTP